MLLYIDYLLRALRYFRWRRHAHFFHARKLGGGRRGFVLRSRDQNMHRRAEGSGGQGLGCVSRHEFINQTFAHLPPMRLQIPPADRGLNQNARNSCWLENSGRRRTSPAANDFHGVVSGAGTVDTPCSTAALCCASMERRNALRWNKRSQ